MNYRLLPCAITLVLATAMHAAVGDTFTVNSCRYRLLSDSTAAFKGVDAGVTDVTVPATVTYDGASYQVTEVADSAFFENTAIQNVTISEGPSAMGVRVFYNDTSLKTVSLPRSVTSIGRNLFYGCTNLESVEFLSRITTLPISCFYKCESLREVAMPNTINSIGEFAFSYCNSLETVHVADNVVNLPGGCFQDLPNLKNIIFSQNSRLKTLGEMSIYGLPSLEVLNLPPSVTTFKHPTNKNNFAAAIGKNHNLMAININNSRYKSFDGVVYSPDKTILYFIPTGLERYEIDSNTTQIYKYACTCGVIKEVVFPEGLETIGESAFCGCESLGNLYFPENLTLIDQNVFRSCKNLGTVRFHPSCKLKRIEYCAFVYAGVSGELVLPNNLEYIGHAAFQPVSGGLGGYGRYGEYTFSPIESDRYGSLTKVVFPSSLKEIDSSAFKCCDMDTVMLNDGLEFLGDAAFAVCRNLKYAYVPASVTRSKVYSGEGIFHRCENLVKIDWLSPILPQGAVSSCYSLPSFTIPDYTTEIGNKAFSHCVSMRQIKIPNSVTKISDRAFYYCILFTHVTLPSHLDSISSGVIHMDDKIYEYTIPANITTPGMVGTNTSTSIVGWNYNRLLNIFIMNDEIPDTLKRTKVYASNKMDTYGKTTFFVKPSVYHEKYPDGKWSGTYIQDPRYSSMNRPVNFSHDVSYKIPVTMKNASDSPIKYKTLCRDFDVDLSHTNDNLPEGVEPLRAYVVEDVDGDLRMVFLNEIKYIPSRLKANATDEHGNLYQGVDEYVGVVLRGTPGYTYYYEMGEHDYTQGEEGQWLMGDAMAYSGSSFSDNLMAGDANDDFYVYKTVLDDDANEIVNYGLNDNRFKIYSKDGWLTYNKSYLQLPKSVSDGVERNSQGEANLTLIFENADGTTDYISSTEFTQKSESGLFYSSMGQRVNGNAKGIIVYKGHKRINR